MAAGDRPGSRVDRTDDSAIAPLQVASNFRGAIKSGITPASSPGDPRGVFRAGQGEARYQVGIESFLTTLVSERALYGAKNSLIATQQAALGNRITLYRVLAR